MILVYTYELVMWAIASLWFPETWTMTWREAEGHSLRCVFQVRTISVILIPHKSTDEKKSQIVKANIKTFLNFNQRRFSNNEKWSHIWSLFQTGTKWCSFLHILFMWWYSRLISDVVRKTCDKSVLPRYFTNKNT